MALTVSRLGRTNVADFYRVHAPEHGEGWCHCVAWWVPDWKDWDKRTAEENRNLREELFARGEYDGYLLYEDGKPVGWCQCGRRDRLTKLRVSAGLQPDPEAWAITCFVLAPSVRGRGLAHRLLEGVLADLAALGVRRVEAFPRPQAPREPGAVWMGPLSIYEKAGFVRVGGRDDWPVLSKELFHDNP